MQTILTYQRQWFRNKSSILIMMLLMVCSVNTPSAFAETRINTEKLKSAAYKTGSLILERVAPEVGDILSKIKSIWQDLKEAFGPRRETVTETMRQKKNVGEGRYCFGGVRA